MIGYLSLPFHALPLPSTADEFVLDTLERLRHASISYRMNVYGEEGIRMYEERAARTLALYKPRPRQPAPAPAGEVERDPVIPSCYTGYQIEAYRDGFHAGHRFAHARATIAAKRARWGRPAPAPGKRGGGAMSAAAIRAAIEAELARSPAPPTTDDIAAAVLQAAADQVVPEAANAVGDQHDEARRDQWLRIRWRLLSIAAKLKGE